MALSNISNNQKREIKTKHDLENIRSDYFLQKIFNNLQKKELLEIIKYNNKIKKRLNINILDYKEYCELYSSIEIEIIPFKNTYGQFINILKDYKSYFHIFFNNTKKEIKRNIINEEDKVKIINIIIEYQVESFLDLFKTCKCNEFIHFKKFFRNNINNMSGMFWGCSSLKEIDLSKFNTNNVFNMNGMFLGCSSLKEINLSKFNTNNVIDMSGMFWGCSSLKEIKLSNFNTNNVIDMNFMFYDCSSLSEINLSNFNTSKVTNMSWMFKGCLSLKEINITSFNINNVTNMSYMFFGCSDELKIKIRNQIMNIKEEAFH